LVFIGLKKYEDSLEPFQKAISLDEDSPFVHFKAGGLLFDNGDSHRNPEIIGAYRTPYSS
jgi:hypothetical protein